MSGKNGKPPTADDMINAAIKATDEKPQLVEITMKQFQVVITSSGRPGLVALPADATDAEIAEFAGWLLTAVLNGYRAERTKNPASRLVLPSTARAT